MTDKELMQEVLDFLVGGDFAYPTKLATDLRERLAQLEQEPVAWVADGVLMKIGIPEKYTGYLYTTPPAAQPAPEDYTALEQALTRLQKRYGELEAKVAAQRQWVGLTDDVLQKIISNLEPLLDAKNQSWAEAEKMLNDIAVTPPAAQPAVQEPVAWEDVLGAIARGWAHPENARKPMDVQLAVAIAKEIQDMYTTPPAAAQRQPLTDEQRRSIVRANKTYHDSDEIDPYGVIDDVEAAHGITGEKT